MFCREAKANDTAGSISLNAGDLVFVSIARMNTNANSVLTIAFIVVWGRAFAQLTTIDHSHPREHCICSDILIRILGAELVSKIVGKVLQAIFGLKSVAQGPGQSGELKR